jgi:hypothetical protein
MLSLKEEHVSQMGYVIETMRYLAPGGDRTCGLTTSIKSIFAFVMLGGIRSCKNARLHISPGAIIKRFLLLGSNKSARGKKTLHMALLGTKGYLRWDMHRGEE